LDSFVERAPKLSQKNFIDTPRRKGAKEVRHCPPYAVSTLTSMSESEKVDPLSTRRLDRRESKKMRGCGGLDVWKRGVEKVRVGEQRFRDFNGHSKGGFSGEEQRRATLREGVGGDPADSKGEHFFWVLVI